MSQKGSNWLVKKPGSCLTSTNGDGRNNDPSKKGDALLPTKVSKYALSVENDGAVVYEIEEGALDCESSKLV
jgi:hypothetical protein